LLGALCAGSSTISRSPTSSWSQQTARTHRHAFMRWKATSTDESARGTSRDQQRRSHGVLESLKQWPGKDIGQALEEIGYSNGGRYALGRWESLMRFTATMVDGDRKQRCEERGMRAVRRSWQKEHLSPVRPSEVGRCRGRSTPDRHGQNLMELSGELLCGMCCSPPRISRNSNQSIEANCCHGTLTTTRRRSAVCAA